MERLRALVVDDHEDALELLCLFLDGLEVVVQGATSGVDALRIAADFRPDIVFLDIGLSDMSGYEVARRLRALPETRHAYITAVTGWGNNADAAKSIEAGMDQHILKPANRDTFEQVLRAAACSRARMRSGG